MSKQKTGFCGEMSNKAVLKSKEAGEMLCGNKQEIEKILPYVADSLQKALRYIAATNFAEVDRKSVV